MSGLDRWLLSRMSGSRLHRQASPEYAFCGAELSTRRTDAYDKDYDADVWPQCQRCLRAIPFHVLSCRRGIRPCVCATVADYEAAGVTSW